MVFDEVIDFRNYSLIYDYLSDLHIEDNFFHIDRNTYKKGDAMRHVKRRYSTIASEILNDKVSGLGYSYTIVLEGDSVISEGYLSNR